MEQEPPYRFWLWKKYEKALRDCIWELKEHGKKVFGEKYLVYYCGALQAHKLTISLHLAKQGRYGENKFTYLSYSVLFASTPVFEDSPHLDFEGQASVLKFLEERMKEIDELVRVRSGRKTALYCK